MALEVSDAYHYMMCQFHRAWALLHLGEWRELRGVLRDGLQMAERNGHRFWARAFRFQTAWLLTQVGHFASARALCEQERPLGEEVQADQLLGSIVLGFAQLGLKRPAAALRAFQEVTGQSTLMRSILQMPLRLGLGQYWLARQAVRPRTRTDAGAGSARGDVRRADVPGAWPPGARRGCARPARLARRRARAVRGASRGRRKRGSPGGVESLRDGRPY